MDLLRVCKKRKYESYAIAYAHASASDEKLDIYYCDICRAYHLTKQIKNEFKKMWKIHY